MGTRRRRDSRGRGEERMEPSTIIWIIAIVIVGAIALRVFGKR